MSRRMLSWSCCLSTPVRSVGIVNEIHGPSCISIKICRFSLDSLSRIIEFTSSWPACSSYEEITARAGPSPRDG